MENQYDLAVIGAGPGGYVAAIRAAQLGMRVAVMEKEQLGGACLNRGCIPTKALLKSAKLFEEAGQFASFGLHAYNVQLDIQAVARRKEEIVEKLRTGIMRLFQAHKIDWIRGEASLVDKGTVLVKIDGQSVFVRAKNILLATGATPTKPNIAGMQLEGVYTSDDILKGVPPAAKRIVIIGGGVIGVEFATFYKAIGAQVTILEALDRLVAMCDRDISQTLASIIRKDGVKIATGALVSKIEKTAHGLLCTYTEKEREQCVEADAILVATGRKAVIASGLLEMGLVLKNQRTIAVNQNFETSIPGVYAIGDVTGGAQLAHVASAEGIAAVSHMAGVSCPVDLTAFASCIYTDPEIAFTGLTEERAKEENVPVEIGKFMMAANGKSLIEGYDRGFIKILSHGQTRRVLGAQMICDRATDLISEITLAIANRLTKDDLLKAIRPHPTLSEGISEALEAIEQKAIHMLPKKK